MSDSGLLINSWERKNKILTIELQQMSLYIKLKIMVQIVSLKNIFSINLLFSSLFYSCHMQNAFLELFFLLKNGYIWGLMPYERFYDIMDC